MPEVQGKTDISPEELKQCAAGMGCTTNDIMAQAPVRYYRCDSGSSKWTYTGVCGCLALTADMTKGIVKLTLVDFKTNRVEFEQECYEGFELTQHNKFFHSFEADDHIVGLCYADDFDAARFAAKVVNLLKLASQVPPGGMPSTTPTKTVHSVVKKPKETKKQEKSGGWFSGLFGKKEPEKPKRPTKLAISGPRNFVHVSHIGYNPKDGFGDIPPEWKELFQTAGIKDEELKDPKTAAFIMKTINAQQEGTLPPPPPPPPAPPSDMKPKKIPTEISQTEAPSDAVSPPPPPPRPMNVPIAPEGRDALLAAIRKGTSLKKISQVPDVKKMTEKEKGDLAYTLRMAMESRRCAVESDDDEEEDDEW